MIARARWSASALRVGALVTGVVAAPAVHAAEATSVHERPLAAHAWSLTAHAYLVTSEPAAEDTVHVSPARLRLSFSEPIEQEFSEVTLVGWDGSRTRLAPRRDPRDARSLVAALPDLEPGGYRAAWRIVSADGHPVAGSFAFYVGPQAAAASTAPSGRPLSLPAAPPSDLPVTLHQHGAPAGSTGEPPVLAAVARGAALATLMGQAGLLALLSTGLGGSSRRVGRTAFALTALAPLLLAGDFLLWLEHAAQAPRVDLAAVQASLGTRSGAVAAARIALALLALWGFGLARRPLVGCACAVLALLLTGATGHPAAIRPSLAAPAKAVHLLAVAIWMGGLLALLLGERDGSEFRHEARRVSAIALGAVIVIAATGVLQAVLFLPSLGALWSSAYGWLVLAKLAGACTLAGATGLLAHAVVFPRESAPGAYERYLLRVPNERPVPTTRVEITFPRGVTVISFAEVPGWSLSILKDRAGRVTGAVWTGEIGVERFVEFPFVGVNPKEPARLVWRAVQTYANGERVSWSGEEDSETPASITEVREPAPDASRLPLLLAALAGLLGLVSLGLALRKA